MTCRRGSTLGFMKLACLPGTTPLNVPLSPVGQGRVHDLECRSPRLRPKFSRRQEPAHPYDFIPADDYRPESAFRLSYFVFLEQFLDFLGGLGMGRPKSVSRTP